MSLAEDSRIVSQSENLSLAHTGFLENTGGVGGCVCLLSEHMQKCYMC